MVFLFTKEKAHIPEGCAPVLSRHGSCRLGGNEKFSELGFPTGAILPRVPLGG